MAASAATQRCPREPLLASAVRRTLLALGRADSRLSGSSLGGGSWCFGRHRRGKLTTADAKITVASAPGRRACESSDVFPPIPHARPGDQAGVTEATPPWRPQGARPLPISGFESRDSRVAPARAQPSSRSRSALPSPSKPSQSRGGRRRPEPRRAAVSVCAAAPSARAASPRAATAIPERPGSVAGPIREEDVEAAGQPAPGRPRRGRALRSRVEPGNHAPFAGAQVASPAKRARTAASWSRRMAWTGSRPCRRRDSARGRLHGERGEGHDGSVRPRPRRLPLPDRRGGCNPSISGIWTSISTRSGRCASSARRPPAVCRTGSR
jgi:hypothetical protein